MGTQNETKKREMLKAFKRQRGLCWICEKPMNMQFQDLNNQERATADHVIPKSMGGWVRGNIKAAHAKCNSNRGNKYHGGTVPIFGDVLGKENL